MALLYSQFPDVGLVNHNYAVRFGEGDWTVTLTKVSGTNDGPLPGSDGNYIPPTQRYANYNFMTIAQWNYGQMLQEYLFSDNPTMYRQLALLPDAPRPDLPFIYFDSMGNTGADNAAANKKFVNASDDAFNAGSTNASELLYSPGLTVYGLSDDPMDLDGYIAWLQGMRHAFSDLKLLDQQIVASGEWTATIGMLSGTQTGSWSLPGYLASAPIPPTNKSFNLLHYVIARWENGKVVDMHVNFDVFGVLGAIGVDVL